MNPGNGRVCLAYTFYDGKVHQPLMESIIGFLRLDGGEEGRGVVTHGGKIVGGSSAYIPDARNNLVKGFLNNCDAEWLWFLDWDVAFRPQDLYLLLDAAAEVQAKIMGGLYFVELENQIYPVFFDQEDKGGRFRVMTEFDTNKTYKLVATGMGFTLIHRSVLEQMRKKFRGPWHWFGHDLTKDDICGEDITFCRRAAKLGHQTYGYTGTKIYHRKYKWLSLDSFGKDENVEVIANGFQGEG